MASYTKALEYFLKIKEVVVALSAVVLWVLALWLSYKLTPYVQSVGNLEIRANSTDRTIQQLEQKIDKNTQKLDTVVEDVSYIRGILDAKDR